MQLPAPTGKFLDVPHNGHAFEHLVFAVLPLLVIILRYMARNIDFDIRIMPSFRPSRRLQLILRCEIIKIIRFVLPIASESHTRVVLIIE